MRLAFDCGSVRDYERFLQVKSLPRYRFVGREAEIPDEYASLIGAEVEAPADSAPYKPWPGLFDYQRDIARMAVRKRKFAAFVDCGLGKTLIELEFARHAASVLPADRAVLIVCPLMVVDQTLAEAERFYGAALRPERVPAATLGGWLASGSARVGITNYDALKAEIEPGRLGALILDESSMLKSHYGKWGAECIRLGRGLPWKLALTGTPAPNDRIEYANHAVFLDAFPTVNSFLARFFVNRGQTDNRWELKPHALRPFYRALSHWCIFLSSPATYGWEDNTRPLPPIEVTIHDVELTGEQRQLAASLGGKLFVADPGGITSRGTLARIAKGCHKGESVATLKPAFIKALIDSWPDESTILWCLYNDEQETLAGMFPEAANIDGSTPIEERRALISDFQAGRRKVLISKPKILGFGLNLQVATRQVFSSLQDSYEAYYQCVKRSNRYGSTSPLRVHVPVTELEWPMVETVLKKAARVDADTAEQEREFRNGF